MFDFDMISGKPYSTVLCFFGYFDMLVPVEVSNG